MNYQDDELFHYGMPRRSGRYPYGSGDDPNQHNGDLLSRTDELKRKGISEKDIAESMGLTTSQLRIQKTMARDARRAVDVATAKALREKGVSLNEIAKKMGFNNDSSVRALLNENTAARMNEARATANALKEHVDKKGMIDVGVGAERQLGVSKEKLNQALYMLELEGYPVYGGGVPQVTNKGRQTNLKILCPPGTEHKEIYNFDKIHYLDDVTSHDDGKTFSALKYPTSLDPKRLKILYAEEGGIQKDGLIELRRNVEDISLGGSHYAQVRMLVGGTHYIKGMAVYSDNMPDGVDVIFNSNKTKGTPALGEDKKNTVLKHIKTDDPMNPFGSLIKVNGQREYVGSDGKTHLGIINKRSDEGDWNEWKDKLPSQFLAKQNLSLIQKQLRLASADKQEEFDTICRYTNPTVKKVLLQSFANDCDSAAEHLKAAALPRQKYHVFLPVPSLKDNEVYAPKYKDGEQLAIVRFPHGGTFEIPILTVNNKNTEARRMMGTSPKDAIGINAKVAERLSGADFDGDAGLTIPTGGKIKISSQNPLKGLEGFDPKMQYPWHEEMKKMNNTQTEMGKISNLITDMTIKGASPDELAAAVRHSMVVIDAEKHNLDYKQSEIDNNISALKKEYQGRIDENGKYRTGASTLLSRAKNEQPVLKRKGSPKVNEKGKDWYDPTRPEGALIWNSVRNEYIDAKTGKVKVSMQKSTQMAETDDARTLSSGHPVEEAYATYANKMKALANQSRKEILVTKKIEYDSQAKATYLNEFNSLMAKLNVALKNAPKERQAQTIANAQIAAQKKENPDMKKGDLKKAGQLALTNARIAVGAKRVPVEITDREWEAIQAGAISETKLLSILNNSNIDEIKQRAMPRETASLSQAKVNKLSAMNASGYSIAQMAEALGISASTVSKYLKGKE